MVIAVNLQYRFDSAESGEHSANVKNEDCKEGLQD